MARRISFDGLKMYTKDIERLNKNSLTIAGKATYQGAKVIADEVKKNLNNTATISNGKALQAWRKGVKAILTESQKKNLVESFGVSPSQNDKGFINVKLGFDGYNDTVTKRWPKGQPNAMIARSLESGSSTFDKQPFFRPAVAAKKNEAIKAMQKVFDEETEKIMR